jgi:hypothetical protein
MVQMGTYTELLSSSSSFARLLEDINQHEEEIRIDVQKQQSIISSIYSEKEDEQDLSNSYTHIDKKQEGIVQWHVYSSYIRAGLSSILGFLFIMLIFVSQQAMTMYSSWWLASWSDDESHRHGLFNNCTSVIVEKISYIRSLNNAEWNTHRNHRFYTYCGEFCPSKDIIISSIQL